MTHRLHDGGADACHSAPGTHHCQGSHDEPAVHTPRDRAHFLAGSCGPCFICSLAPRLGKEAGACPGADSMAEEETARRVSEEE